jgi:hypothetical protein
MHFWTIISTHKTSIIIHNLPSQPLRTGTKTHVSLISAMPYMLSVGFGNEDVAKLEEGSAGSVEPEDLSSSFYPFLTFSCVTSTMDTLDM